MAVKLTDTQKTISKSYEAVEIMGSFYGAPVLLEKVMTDKLWLFRLRLLADIFSKKSRMSLLLQGKQLTVFFANDKI